MPATEETYRGQPALHLVFAISSVAMLVVTVWMVMADHLRPWKEVQREFQLIERDKLKAAEKEKQDELDSKYKNDLKDVNDKIEAANAGASERAGQIDAIGGQISRLDAAAEELDMQRRFKKTELDSKRSLYDGMIDRAMAKEDEHQAREYLSTVVTQAERELVDLSKKLEKAQADLKAKKDEKSRLLGNVEDLTKEKDRLTRERDRVQRLVEQKDALYGGPLNWYSARWRFCEACRALTWRPDEDPADQSSRAVDQLQFQGSSSVRPLPDVPPGHRSDRL